MTAQRPTIGIFLFDDAEELDWAGPWEVLASWAHHWPDDGVRVLTVARDTGPVTCAKGLRVLSDHTWANCPPLDVLVYPGGRGTRGQVVDEEIISDPAIYPPDEVKAKLFPDKAHTARFTRTQTRAWTRFKTGQ